MRFQLCLSIERQVFGSRLPINYQYELSAWIYKIIAQGDRQYAEWLHQNGFSEKRRNFRLFVFSHIYSPGCKAEKDRLVFHSLSPARSKLVRIKSGTKEETQVRGYLFTFRLEADNDLLKIMYEAGMGEKNAQGFGCIERTKE